MGWIDPRKTKEPIERDEVAQCVIYEGGFERFPRIPRTCRSGTVGAAGWAPGAATPWSADETIQKTQDIDRSTYMTISPSLSPSFAYCIGATGLMGLANMYGAITVVGARKKYGIKYPKMYADGDSKDATAFNCAQRAHQNTLEGLPITAINMLACGTVYPLTSAALGAVWSIGRVLYIRGYATNGPDGRMVGALVSHLGDFPLMLLACFLGVKTVLQLK